MVHFAGNARREVGQEIQPRTADIVDRDVAAHGCVEFVPLQDVAEIADPAGRQCLDRPGADRVDANAFGAEIIGEILHARFQRRLGHAHDIVMRDDFFRAVIGQRQDAATRRHQRPRTLGGGDQRIGRDVHRHQEVFEAGVDVLAAQFVLVRKADGVDEEIELAPLRFDLGKGGVHRVHVRHVAFDQEVRPDLLRQRAHALLQRLSLVGEGHFRAMLVQLLRDAPSQRLVVGEPHDEALLSLHKRRHYSAFSSSAFVLACLRARLSACPSLSSSSSGVSASAAFSSAPATIPSPTSQKKKRAIMIPASDP